MKHALAALALVASLALSACATGDGPPASPREQSQQLQLGYLALQTPALAAVESPQLEGKDQIKTMIAAVTHAATEAVLAFDDEARKCVRDPQSMEIVDAPGQHCEPDLLKRTWAAAQSAIANAGQILKAFGFATGGG